jgi:hypothetical protein
MNSFEKEINNYMRVAENMSGYDGMDYFEGDLSAFDDYDSMEGETAFDYATGGASDVNVSDPYVIQYTNGNAFTVTAVLFGYNNNFQSATFGNPAGVTILNLQGSSYLALLGQSASKNFKIGKWRYQSTTAGQLSQTMTLSHFDANGKQFSTPLNLSILRDAYQFQSDILDVTKVITIDANTQITFPLLANAVLVISMFPVAILSGKAVLNGGQSLNTAIAPQLSGKNSARVNIITGGASANVVKR